MSLLKSLTSISSFKKSNKQINNIEINSNNINQNQQSLNLNSRWTTPQIYYCYQYVGYAYC